jgi:hypothetical protein
MNGWWDKKAGDLQRTVRLSEDEIGEAHSAADARRATVHGRQDLILITSYLSSLNRQIATIKVLLSVLTVLVALALFRL